VAKRAKAKARRPAQSRPTPSGTRKPTRSPLRKPTRSAPPKPTPQTRDELAALFAEFDAASAAGKLVPYDDMDRAGNALVTLSRLPADIAHQLGSGFGTLPCWPSHDEILDFALSYEPPASREELFAFIRRWIDDDLAERTSMHRAIGDAVLYERHAALGISELDRMVEILRTTALRQQALRQLRKLVAAPSE
jgi:hypothetical protein